MAWCVFKYGAFLSKIIETMCGGRSLTCPPKGNEVRQQRETIQLLDGKRRCHVTQPRALQPPHVAVQKLSHFSILSPWASRPFAALTVRKPPRFFRPPRKLPRLFPHSAERTSSPRTFKMPSGQGGKSSTLPTPGRPAHTDGRAKTPCGEEIREADMQGNCSWYQPDPQQEAQEEGSGPR